MIEFQEAQRIVIEKAKQLSVEEVSLGKALNSVLAEDVISKINLPPFDNSAMDGFACRFEDGQEASSENPISLEVIDNEPAGKVSKEKVERGTAIKIMTGAPIPEGANAVIPIEYTEEKGSKVSLFKPLKEGENIRLAGEDIREREVVFRKGNKIGPHEIGLLAALGVSSIKVWRKPVVAFISTESELVDISEQLTPGKIRDSNSYLLQALIEDCGAIPLNLGRIGDDKEKIKEKIKEALSKADVVVTTGGVSVGEYDLVKDAILEAGTELAFWKVAQKPAKPIAFFIVGDKLIFGLPGNPGAVIIGFEEYVRPALLKIMGHKRLFYPVIKAKLSHDIRKKPGRINFMRVVVYKKDNNYYVSSSGGQGSGILKSFIKSNGLALIPKERDFMNEGEEV
ncbi:MAG: molybdopterin molybdotransferase MoeA, partial [Actinomycetia bacterium]|nr:molybdopterin molybdotransferase MoeA [Actinomycetes bacterium]